MRIIAGKYKNYKIDSPISQNTKPTTGIIREALFNILNGGRFCELEGAIFLDLFCGTGAIAFEAISRGASHAILVDNDANQLKYAESNAKKMGIAKNITVIRSDACLLPKAFRKCDIIFADPPYESVAKNGETTFVNNKDLHNKVLKSLKKQGWIDENSLIVFEISKLSQFQENPDFEFVEERVYGKSKIVIMKCKGDLV